jgi:hypothetical protein
VRTRLILLATVATALWSARSDAAGVTWVAPAGECPDQAAFTALVSEMSGARAPAKDVRAEAWHDDAGWHVRVVTDAASVREIHADSCAEVARAAALVIGMLDADSEEPEARPPPPAPASPPTQVRRVAAIAPSRPSWLDLRVDAGAGLGALPGVAPQVALTLGLRLGDYRAELGGRLWFAGRANVADGAGADFTLITSDARGCFAPGRWRACALVELGQLTGRGFGTTMDATGTSTWLAFGGALAYRFKYSSRLAFIIDLEALLPTERAVFKVGGEEAHVVAPVDLTFAVGVETTIF